MRYLQGNRKVARRPTAAGSREAKPTQELARRPSDQGVNERKISARRITLA